MLVGAMVRLFGGEVKAWVYTKVRGSGLFVKKVLEGWHGVGVSWVGAT